MTNPPDGAGTAAREAAFAVLERAYAPYSHFRVGAALVGRDGSVHVGCNVENAAYPAGFCAERAAVAAAVASGVRRFARIVIATEATEPTPPCGMCRQLLVEFEPSLPIICVTCSGREAEWTLDALLPRPFTPHALTHS